MKVKEEVTRIHLILVILPNVKIYLGMSRYYLDTSSTGCFPVLLTE